MKHRVRIVVAAVLLIGTVAGCGSSEQAATGNGKITVFAAASLKKAFTEIGERFTTDNPGSEVEFSFAGSADLVTQLPQGAPADSGNATAVTVFPAAWASVA